MIGDISLLYLPLLAAVILSAIHACLGQHVVERSDLFSDLSLIQLAALGRSVAAVSGHESDELTTCFWSFAFTVVGAALLTFTAGRRTVRRDAIVAAVYAVSTAAAILVISRFGSDNDQVEEMLVGNILSVSAATVIRAAVVYALAAAFLFMFRNRLTALSAAVRSREGWSAPSFRMWNFLYYTVFGFVAAWSVAIAGAPLLFSYLIIPTVAALPFARSAGARLAVAWTIGVVASAIGILAAFKADLPTGPAIVCTLGLALFLGLKGRRRDAA